MVAVSRAYPSALSNLREALPNLLTYLGLASLLGGLGSYLLSRRLKRQTLGLEPREITGLVEHREALLSGIKEGVTAVDLDGRLTLINEQAATVLGVPLLSRGTAVSRVGEHAILAAIFDPQTPATDRVLPVGSRLVTVNRMPVISRGRHIGWVATLRDRTETLELQREWDLNKSTTDVLRAQAHEFSNRMHVVSGMIALEEYDDVLAYITRITDDQTQLATSVTEHVEDPAVAALLLAKVSRARERHVDFTITPSTRLGRLQPDLSADVNTVVGNLVDKPWTPSWAGRLPACRWRSAPTPTKEWRRSSSRSGTPDRVSSPGWATSSSAAGPRQSQCPGRVHPDVRSSFIMTPALVVAFTLSGDAAKDIETAVLGRTDTGQEVRLADIWPSESEVKSELAHAIRAADFPEAFAEAHQSPAWRRLPSADSSQYPWSPTSTILRPSPFAVLGNAQPMTRFTVNPLLVLDDDITTDHISPASAIPPDSPVADFLVERGEDRDDLNVFASRRGNWEVMARGAFTNRHLVNDLIGMGILPLILSPTDRARLGVIRPGDEFDIDVDAAGLRPGDDVALTVRRAAGDVIQLPLPAAVETTEEVTLLRAGGAIPFILRQFS